jgi:predicted O-methyltransferase YrrM
MADLAPVSDLDLWTAVDDYTATKLGNSDPVVESALEQSQAAGLPALAVAANQAKLLQILARSVRAERILEIGTLGGYSTIALARALSEQGRLITLELEDAHARVARQNLERAGLAQRVEIVVGPALEGLPKLHERQQRSGGGQFDFTFIDADKFNIPAYFDWAIKLSRSGALIVVDNVVRKGALIDANSADESVIGVRRLHDMLEQDSRVSASTLQTVGIKGYDGLTFAIVN